MIVEHDGKLDGISYTETGRSALRIAPLPLKDPEH